MQAALKTFGFALAIDLFVIRMISIILGSLFEAKINLNNCYYLTEAHSNHDTTRGDLAEEELNLLGEFYDMYDKPIVRLEDSSTVPGKDPSENY